MNLTEKSEFDFPALHRDDDLLSDLIDAGIVYRSHKHTLSLYDSVVSSNFLSFFESRYKVLDKYINVIRNPVCLIKTTEVFFLPEYGVLISKSGEIFKESFEEARWVTPTKAKLPFTSVTNGEAEFNPPASIDVIEKAFVCMPLGATVNYGHFITDCLTAIHIYREFIEKNEIPLLVPKLKGWQKSHLELLNLQVPIIETDQNILKIGTCYHSNIMNHFLHNMTRDVSSLAEAQISAVNKNGFHTSNQKRLYISRKNQELRRFSQEEYLSTALQKLGFAIIYPEMHSVSEQIAIFNQADIIVGLTGAGFANVAYCSPATAVIEIMPESFSGNVWVRNLCVARHCFWMPIVIPELKPRDQVFVEGILRSEGGLSYDPEFDYNNIINDLMPLVKLHYKHFGSKWPSQNHPEKADEYSRPLKELAVRHKTDKQGAHNYSDNYETHFKRFRDAPVKVLEIGIGGYDDPSAGGESLRMWREYFPHGLIVGLDYYEKSIHRQDGILTYRGSQDDHLLLKTINEEVGPFDLIIDDGSHMNAHVLSSFSCLFPLLKEGGIYAVEDIQTSYWKKTFGGSSIDLNIETTSMGFFKRLADGLNYKELERPGYIPSYYDENISSIHFYHNQIFVLKNKNVEESNVVVANMLPKQYASFD